MVFMLAFSSCGFSKEINGLYFYKLKDGTYGVKAGETLQLEQIVIPETYKGKPVTRILPNAFEGSTNLTEIIIPSSITAIEDEAFKYCFNLTSVIIPESVISIGDSAFSNCLTLAKIILPNSLTIIGDFAFDNCTSLTSIVIPDRVTYIGEYAFDHCTNLTNVIIGDNVTTIGGWEFGIFKGLKYVVVLDNDEGVGSVFDFCSQLNNISVSENNQYYKSINGNLYSKDEKTLIKYAIGKKDTSFAIPNSVTTIGNYALAHCSALTSVVIPNNVTTIDIYAFYRCNNLASVELKDKRNWQCSHIKKSVSILESDLANTSTAAQYLTSTYCDYTWTKK